MRIRVEIAVMSLSTTHALVKHYRRYQISPMELQAAGIGVTRHVQRQHEYVVVWPDSYVACVSMTFNISESLPLAVATWMGDEGMRNQKVTRIDEDFSEKTMSTCVRILFYSEPLFQRLQVLKEPNDMCIEQTVTEYVKCFLLSDHRKKNFHSQSVLYSITLFHSIVLVL